MPVLPGEGHLPVGWPGHGVDVLLSVVKVTGRLLGGKVVVSADTNIYLKYLTILLARGRPRTPLTAAANTLTVGFFRLGFGYLSWVLLPG